MKENNKGFTVVELIVSIALLALILVPVAGFFTNSFHIQGKTEMRTAVTRVGQHIIENFKNKNYLGDSSDPNENLNTISEDADTFQSVMDSLILYGNKTEGYKLIVRDNEGSYEIQYGKKTVKHSCVDDYMKGHSWKLTYNNVEYDINIETELGAEMDFQNLEVPTEAECWGSVGLKDNNDIFLGVSNNSAYSNLMSISAVKPNVPVDVGRIGVHQTADYPTIILSALAVNSEGYIVDDNNNKPVIKLWVKNAGYGFFDKDEELAKEKDVRIIKDFKNELQVYIEGYNFGVVEGPKSVNLPKEYYKIKSLALGDDVKEREQGEVIFDAKMVVTHTSDDTVKDSFDFTFPANYVLYETKPDEES